jgi:hypothetical protein
MTEEQEVHTPKTLRQVAIILAATFFESGQSVLTVEDSTLIKLFEFEAPPGKITVDQRHLQRMQESLKGELNPLARRRLERTVDNLQRSMEFKQVITPSRFRTLRQYLEEFNIGFLQSGSEFLLVSLLQNVVPVMLLESVVNVADFEATERLMKNISKKGLVNER